MQIIRSSPGRQTDPEPAFLAATQVLAATQALPQAGPRANDALRDSLPAAGPPHGVS
jgi:hypothetical protein